MSERTFHVSLSEAKCALADNDMRHISAESHPILRNLNTALFGICDALERMSHDVGLLHQKLRPVLKTIADDQFDLHQWTIGQ